MPDSTPCLEDCPVDGCPYACGNQMKGHGGDHVCANGHRWLIAFDGTKESVSCADRPTTELQRVKSGDSSTMAGTIRVRFKNASGIAETWTAVDVLGKKDLFVDRLFQGLEVFPDPNDDLWIDVVAQNSEGEILYQRQGQSAGAHQFVTDGKEIGMY